MKTAYNVILNSPREGTVDLTIIEAESLTDAVDQAREWVLREEESLERHSRLKLKVWDTGLTRDELCGVDPGLGEPDYEAVLAGVGAMTAKPPIDGITDGLLEDRTTQALITAAWWLREVSGELSVPRSAQVRLVAGDLTKIINERLAQ